MFALLRPAMQCTESTSWPKYRTKTWYAQHGGHGKDNKSDQFLKYGKQSGTQFHHDGNQCSRSSKFYKKNFQEDHTNSRRFPQFPGVVDTLNPLWLWQHLSQDKRLVTTMMIWSNSTKTWYYSVQVTWSQTATYTEFQRRTQSFQWSVTTVGNCTSSWLTL